MIRRHLTAALAALGALVAPLAASSQIAVSQLPAASALAGTEVAPLVQSGQTRKATVDQLATRAITVFTGQANTFTLRQTINRTGGSTIPLYMSDAALQAVGSAGAPSILHTDTFGAQGGGFIVRRADGTPTAPVAVINHHVFGLFGGTGYDGAAWGDTPASYMSSSPGEDWSPGNHGAQLNFVTTPNGTTGAVTVGSFMSDGTLTSRGDNLRDLGFSIERWRALYVYTVDLASTGAMRWGSTSADPKLIRSGNVIVVKLADDSGMTGLQAKTLFLENGSRIFDGADGLLTITNNAGTSLSGLQFGGTSVSFPMLKPSGQKLQARLADDSNDAPVTTLTVRTKSQTLAQLNTAVTSAAAAGAGTRAFINDANTTLILGIGTVAVGGGANLVPVYSDGTDWRIG
jgi:hypothetical protein